MAIPNDTCITCCTCPTITVENVTPIEPPVYISSSYSSSSQSTVEVHGFSAYDDGSFDPEHPGRWAYRDSKWRTKDNSGSIERKDGKCVDPSWPVEQYGRYRWDVTGSDTISECGTLTSTTETKRYDQDIPTDSNTCNPTSVLVYTYYGVIGGFPIGYGSDVTSNYLTQHITGTETLVDSSAYYGVVTSTLSDRSGVAGAIGCGDVTTGIDRCARNGPAYGFTTPESDDPIIFGGSTSVTVSITVQGEPDSSYTIIITYSNSQADTDENGVVGLFYSTPDTTESVGIITDEDGNASFDLDIPDTLGSNTRRCFNGAEVYRGAEYEQYRLRFPLPKTNTGRNYKANWAERFIPSSGVSISSVTVVSGGVYRPPVTISESPSNGNSAYGFAVLSSAGEVISISLLNPGTEYIPLITFSGGSGSGASATAVINSAGAVIDVIITSGGQGYLSAPSVAFTNVIAPRIRATGTAIIENGSVIGINIGTAGDFRPTVTVSDAQNGGTTSTGWVASLNPINGQINSITGGTAGNYLPTLTFAGGGGSSATATCTLNPLGGINLVTITNSGSGYISEPSLSVISKTESTVTYDADLLVHLGTETNRCAVWDGTTLGGEWVSRVISEYGDPLSSIEVVYGGSDYSFTPNIYIENPKEIAALISAPAAGGTQAYAIANVDTEGRVTGIQITSEGSGYDSVPTVTVIAPGTGGTQSTGWTAVLTSGRVTSIEGGTTGDYAITATVTVTDGSISSVTVNKAGAGLKSNPRIAISNRGNGDVFLAAHFGTETTYADGSQPAGSIPLGYVEGVVETYPIIGNTGTAPWKYFLQSIPEESGLLRVSNLRAVCDGTTC
jgi:hypothetical protein